MRNDGGDGAIVGEFDPTGEEALAGLGVEKIGVGEAAIGPNGVTDDEGAGGGDSSE